jgi:hypothetical protein
VAETEAIKVSVLTSGEVLLDKEPVTLADLELALEQGARMNAQVWYYRENPAGEPPPVVAEVIKLITSRRLPIRLSTKPDFSDSIAPSATLEENFAGVRKQAGNGRVIVARSDGQYLAINAKLRESVPPEAVATVEKMLPSTVQRNVAVIGDTTWAHAEAPTLQIAGKAIPFFGILLGFASIGHAVWVFHATTVFALTAGCRDADVLIVDSACESGLPQNWQQFARAAMRHRDILIHDRATSRLRKA